MGRRGLLGHDLGGHGELVGGPAKPLGQAFAHPGDLEQHLSGRTTATQWSGAPLPRPYALGRLGGDRLVGKMRIHTLPPRFMWWVMARFGLICRLRSRPVACRPSSRRRRSSPGGLAGAVATVDAPVLDALGHQHDVSSSLPLTGPAGPGRTCLRVGAGAALDGQAAAGVGGWRGRPPGGRRAGDPGSPRGRRGGGRMAAAEGRLAPRGRGKRGPPGPPGPRKPLGTAGAAEPPGLPPGPPGPAGATRATGAGPAAGATAPPPPERGSA